MAACKEGKPQWGDRGPQNAGCYNSLPPGVPFFEDGQESFLSDYGRFFLVCILSSTRVQFLCQDSCVFGICSAYLNNFYCQMVAENDYLWS